MAVAVFGDVASLVVSWAVYCCERWFLMKLGMAFFGCDPKRLRPRVFSTEFGLSLTSSTAWLIAGSAKRVRPPMT